MALREPAIRRARPLVTLPSDSTFVTVARRSAEWVHEFPQLVRGLFKLAYPLRWHFAAIFAFNAVIALWETVQPFILAWGVDTFGKDVPYIEMVTIIVVPLLVLSVPHGIVLPFLRDMYAAWFVKPRFAKHVGMLCLEREQSPERALEPEVAGKKAPIAQEGRAAAFTLIDMITRDPAFAARGFVVLGVLCFKSPILVGILIIGIVADLWVTLLMDARLVNPYANQREHEFRVRSLEYQLLDGHTPPAGEPPTSEEAGARKLGGEWNDYVSATRYVEIRRLIYQLPIREGVSMVIRIAVMLVVAWWVHIGDISIGDYILFTSLAGRANDPLYVFLGFQQHIMTTREPIRRLGLLCGIDFGIPRPEPVAAN